MRNYIHAWIVFQVLWSSVDKNHVLVEISLVKGPDLAGFDGKFDSWLTAVDSWWNFFGQPGWETEFMNGLLSKFHEPGLIRTMDLVEISLGL